MDDLTALDEETATLILQIQLVDSLGLFETFEGKGKHLEGELTDAQLALQICTEDLKRNAAIISDRQMTQSRSRACQSDENLLIATLSQERAAASDRETACRLGGVAQHAPVEPWTAGSEFLNDETLEKLRALYVSTPLEAPATETESPIEPEGNNAESSTWAA
jgi:hypothetical protein